MFKANSKYLIETPDGFVNFHGLQTVKKDNSITINCGHKLVCSLNHRIKTVAGFKLAQDITIDDYLICKDGIKKVLTIEKNNKPIILFDPIEVGSKHEYISNNIVSHNCEFLGSGDTYIDGEILKQLNEQVSHEFRSEFAKRLRVFEQPFKQYEYVLSVDVSLGRGLDYSAFHVINIYNGRQVAEFYSNSTPINQLADIIFKVARKYNNAYVIIERNTLGHVLIDKMFNTFEYENLIQDEKGELGIQVSTGNRENILAIMEEFIRMRHLKILSQRTVNELNTFIINENGKAEADENMHDDLVLALALGCYCIKELIQSIPMEHSHEFSEMTLPENPIKSSIVGYETDTEKDLYKWLLS